jgi:hypothetical protein
MELMIHYCFITCCLDRDLTKCNLDLHAREGIYETFGTKWVGVGVTFLTCIREVFDSNLGKDIGYPS